MHPSLGIDKIKMRLNACVQALSQLRRGATHGGNLPNENFLGRYTVFGLCCARQ